MTLDEDAAAGVHAVGQRVRLVLGTLLDVSEDDETRPGPSSTSSPEYQLYAYLSWLLDSAIQAMSRRPVGATSDPGRRPRFGSYHSCWAHLDAECRWGRGPLLVSRCSQLEEASCPHRLVA